MQGQKRSSNTCLTLPAALVVLLWVVAVGAGGKKPSTAKPLPWASNPAVVSDGGLTVRAKDQLIGANRREMTGFRFEVENTTAEPRTLRAVELEVLWAWSDWPPPAPGESRDRVPKARKLVIRGCWYEDGARKITEVRKGGRGPVSVTVPPESTLRIMLRFEPVRREGGHAYWRRLTFSVGGPARKVTGPLVPIRFSEDSVGGELVNP